MALVREIVECLTGRGKDELELRLHNFDEVVHEPTVKKGEPLEYTPGFYDAPAARFVVEIRGVKFIKEPNDEIWHLEDDADLFGVRCFVDSNLFREMGYEVWDMNDKRECQKMALKVVSDLLNKLFDLHDSVNERYEDHPRWFYSDFENIRSKLHGFEYAGYRYDGGRWFGVKYDKGRDVKDAVSSSVCAMGLLLGVDVETAKETFIIKFSKDDLEKLLAVLKTCEDKSSVRKFLMEAKGVKDDRAFLIAPTVFSQARSLVLQSDHEERETVLKRFEKARAKWRRDAESELSMEIACARIQLNFL